MKLLTIKNLSKLYDSKILNKRIMSVYGASNEKDELVYVIKLENYSDDSPYAYGAAYEYIAIHREIKSPYDVRYVVIQHKIGDNPPTEIKLLVSSFATLDKFIYRLHCNLNLKIK